MGVSSEKMKSAKSICSDIKIAFAGVPFPSHGSLHAAMAKDDWVDDENTLRDITLRDDFNGEWWDVPRAHLHQCMMALSYLDAQGMAFYLPAYMSAILEEPEEFDRRGVKSSSWQVIHTMLPNNEDRELEKYFLEQFSAFDGAMKRVCVEFLAYVATCSAYDEHARQIAKEALAHEFWSIKS
jgi:hypothetical protein